MTTHDAELHTRLFDSVTDPFAIYDREFRILKVNKALMELFHLPEEQLTGRFCYEAFYGRTSACEECHVKEVFQTGQPRMLEKTFPQPGGSERIFEVYSYPIKDSEGITVQAVEHARDITKRKRAEEKLRESEEKYRSLMDHIGVGVSLISPDMEILTLNKQMKNWFPEINPENRPLCYRSFNDPPRDGVCSYCPTIKTLQDGKVHEAVTETPAGNEIRNYRIISSPIKDKEGKVVAAIESVEDITERKRAQELLRESKEQFRQAFENANIGMCLVDTEGRFMKVNNRMCEIFGYSQEELEGMTVNDITHPDYLDVSPRFIQRASSGEITHAEFEKQYYHKNGHLVWGHVASSLVRDVNDAPFYFISHVKDITARKSLEDQLQASKEFSENIINSITDNLIVVDPRTHEIVQANDAFYSRVGLEPLAVVGKTCHEIMHDRSTPCGESGIRCPMEETLRTKSPSMSDKVYPNAAGEERWFEVATYPLLDSQGEVSSIIRLERDVTEKREMEEALTFRSKELQKTQHQLETLFDISRHVSAKDSLPEVVHFVQKIGQGIFPESEMLFFLLDGEKQRFLDLEEYNLPVIGSLLRGLYELEQSGLVSDFVKYLQDIKEAHIMSSEYNNDIPPFLRSISKSYPSWFGFPISTPHQSIGYFLLGSTISQHYSREDLHFFHNLFSQIAGDIHHLVRHETEINLLRQEVAKRTSHGEIIGQSDEMQKIYELIDLVSGSDATVLIAGENGTGKCALFVAEEFTFD